MTDREKLIKLLRPWLAHLSLCAADDLLANGVTFAKDINVPSRWMPVAERMPFAEYGESDDVLAITELGVMRTLYFDGGNWCFQNGECCPHKVTHWMPLPEPPKEGE